MKSFQQVNTNTATIKNCLPQIDLDHFDSEVMKKIWEEYGTFELVGKTIDDFKKEFAMRTMEFSKIFLDLKNIDKLKEADDQGSFNGFQDVQARTTKRVTEGFNVPIRKQIAYLLKPDLMPERRVPEGIEGVTDVKMFEDYYAEAKTKILYELYNKIADAFIKPEFRSDLSQEKGSTFATRKYMASQSSSTEEKNLGNENVQKAKKVGIPPHTDFGLLTMVIQDAPGLEALTTSCEWIMAPCDTKNYKVIINIGDWALFQAFQSGYTQFKEGLHRVLEVDKHSLIVELNPPYSEKILTPKGVEVEFEPFLHGGQKGKYRDTSRDECADTISEIVSRLKPVNPITDFPRTPTLYVTECGKAAQDPWICVSGKDYPLCSREIPDVPEKAYDSFSYAYLNPEDRNQSFLPSRETDKFARTYEINLKCANDIYVVDESVSENIAKTLIPLAEYNGNCEQPVYLINRPLLADEARNFISEKKYLLQSNNIMKNELNLTENKNENITNSLGANLINKYASKI